MSFGNTADSRHVAPAGHATAGHTTLFQFTTHHICRIHTNLIPASHASSPQHSDRCTVAFVACRPPPKFVLPETLKDVFCFFSVYLQVACVALPLRWVNNLKHRAIRHSFAAIQLSKTGANLGLPTFSCHHYIFVLCPIPMSRVHFFTKVLSKSCHTHTLETRVDTANWWTQPAPSEPPPLSSHHRDGILHRSFHWHTCTQFPQTQVI